MQTAEGSENLPDSIEIHHMEAFSPIEMKNHFHNSYEVIYIYEGRAKFKINEKIYEAGKNSIIFISNLESHELEVLEAPYRRYFILVKPEHFQAIINQPVLASIFKHRPGHFKHVIELEEELSSRLEEIIRSMHHEYESKKDFWDTTLVSSLNILFVLLYRSCRDSFPLLDLNRSTNTILQIQKYIDENFTEDISLAEISKQFYTDFYYLSHLFKKVTGFGFKDYLILQRLSKAKTLLFYTSDNIVTVALNSGFGNVNHFIRIFKKYEGVTPHRYRKLQSAHE